MIRCISPLLAFIFLAFQAWAQPPNAFEYGPRPPLPVFDPAGLMSPEMTKELGRKLTEFQKNEGIDVLVIVDSNFDKVPPELIAKRFADAWSSSVAHCVVLHIPGREGTPWIFPGGDLFRLMNPVAVKAGVDAIKRRALAEPVEINKVRLAATESADLLRFWLGSAIERSRELESTQQKAWEKAAARHRLKKFLMIAAVAATIPIFGGLGYLIYAGRQRKPRYFPSRVWQPRLGAPYSGGNHIIAKIGRSSFPPKSRP